MSTADRAVLAVRDGGALCVSSLAVQITKPEERGSLAGRGGRQATRPSGQTGWPD